MSMPSKPFQDLTNCKLKRFTGAEKVLRSPNQWLMLARWNHSEAVGWYLYVKPRYDSQYNFLASAGEDSLSWTKRKVEKWARGFMKNP
jgi:hypothetical protein